MNLISQLLKKLYHRSSFIYLPTYVWRPLTLKVSNLRYRTSLSSLPNILVRELDSCCMLSWMESECVYNVLCCSSYRYAGLLLPKTPCMLIKKNLDNVTIWIFFKIDCLKFEMISSITFKKFDRLYLISKNILFNTI